MVPHRTRKRNLKTLIRDQRGVAVVLVTAFLPVIVGLFTFATDMAYVYAMRQMLQVTAEAAALAATAQLPDNTACGGATSACTIAQSYADKNMPTTRYGTVVANADVVTGRWDEIGKNAGTCIGDACFTPYPTGQDCIVNLCNAVKVIARQAAANGNALNLVFAPLIGISSFDVTATAIAVFGTPAGSNNTWNVMIAQDISGSFYTQLPLGKAADQALLDCIRNNAGAGSKLGIVTFAGCSGSSCNPTVTGCTSGTCALTNYRNPLDATNPAQYNILKNAIGDPNNRASGMQNCVEASHMPTGCADSSATGQKNCSVAKNTPLCSTSTNQSAGMAPALTQLTGVPGQKAMIIVSDGLPVCGVGAPAGCTEQTLKDAAVAQADAAKAAGIDIYTIFYGTDAAGSSWLSTLIRGQGLAFNTPNASELATLMGRICSKALSHRLVW